MSLSVVKGDQAIRMESAPTGGTFTITRPHPITGEPVTTAPLPWNASEAEIAAAIQAAVDDLPVAAMSEMSQAQAYEVTQLCQHIRQAVQSGAAFILPARRLSQEQVIAVLETMTAEGVMLEYSQSQGFRPRTGEVPE